MLHFYLLACTQPATSLSDDGAERVPIALNLDHPDYVLGDTAFSVIGDIDVNGDGYPDVFMAEQEEDALVYTWHGTADGFREDDANVYLHLGYEETAREAIPIAAADVNGDGYDDVFATDHDSQQVFGYPGGPDGPAEPVTWTVPAPSDGVASIGNAGDVNRDGYEDLVVGMPEYGASPSRVVIYLGSVDGPRSDGSATELHARDNPGDALDVFGFALDGAGDVNGDGWPDIVVGGNSGYTQVFYGSEAGLRDEATTVLETVGMTWSVAGVGDTNGDGFDDVLIGTPRPDFPKDCGPDDCDGEALLFLGGADGVPATPTASRTRPDIGALYGYAVAPAGDINGDGMADVIAGVRSEPEIFLGTPDGIAAEPLCRPESHGPAGGWAAGDIDRDGLGDVVMAGGNVYLATTLLADLAPAPDTPHATPGCATAAGSGSGALLILAALVCARSRRRA